MSAATIEAGAIALINRLRREENDVPAFHMLEPGAKDGALALATAVLSSLKPGDALPGGLVVEQGLAFSAIHKALQVTSGMLDAAIKWGLIREDREPVTLILNGASIGTYTYQQTLDMADSALGLPLHAQGPAEGG